MINDFIINKIINSDAFRKFWINVIIYIIMMVARFHISIILGYVIYKILDELSFILSIYVWFTNDYLNYMISTISSKIFYILYFLSGIFLNLLLHASSHIFQLYISVHQREYQKWIDYIIRNYSEENIKLWKRYVVATLFIYICIGLYLVDINNYTLFESLMQYACSFVIIEMWEQQYLWYLLDRYYYVPSVKISEPIRINETYIEPVYKKDMSMSDFLLM